MTNGGASKSLKEQNRFQLWLTIALNSVVFWAVVRSEAIAAEGWKELLAAAANLVPVGFALIFTSIANGLLSAEMKARLVFLRRKHPLPGHRAFSRRAATDPRVDEDILRDSLGGAFPESPEAENKAWYRFFKEVEAAPEVQNAHREFLLMRDYAGLSILFLVGLGIPALAVIQSWKISLVYCFALLSQYVVVRHVAATYGARFVSTVLAVGSARSAIPSPQ